MFIYFCLLYTFLRVRYDKRTFLSISKDAVINVFGFCGI